MTLRGIWPAGSDAILVEGPLTGGWWVFGRFFVHGGDLSLAEVKIFPGAGSTRQSVEMQKPAEQQDPSRAGFGEWSESTTALDFVNAPASIYPGLMRQVSIPKLEQVARGVLESVAATADWLDLVAPDDPSAQRFVEAARGLSVREVQERHSDYDMARWANLYAAACRRNARTPISALAEQTHKPASVVRDLIHRARRAEMLTRPGQGRPGGQLTNRAVEILRRHGEISEEGS